MDGLYVFQHVFKTAGTTFNLSYVPAAFGPEAFVLRGSDEPNLEDRQRALAFSPAERASLKLIAGHNTGDLRPYYREARFLSLVRDPVERSISGYLHYKYHPDTWDRTGRQMHETNMGLAEFMEANLFNKAHNWQTRLLLGPEFMTSEPRSDAEITAAIRSRFHLIGYTEAFDPFLFFLHITCEFPLVLFNNRLVREEREAYRPSVDDLAAVDRYNRLDQGFYRCARAEFDRKAVEAWTPDVERAFQEYEEALDRYRSSTNKNPCATPLRWSSSGVSTSSSNAS